jgi:hypothetical protein
MQKIFRTLLFWTLILCACSTGVASSPAVPPSNAETIISPEPNSVTSQAPFVFPTTAIPDTKLIVTVGTPHIDQPPDGDLPNTTDLTPSLLPPLGECGYQWAYEDLPELSKQLQEEIMTLNSEATAWGTAFGEDCVYADGHADFSAMETDFYVQLPVTDLANFESFGNWMTQVMQVVEGLPRDLLAGPQAGFVEFKFTKSDTEFLFVRVPIQQFRETASGKTGEELFRMFYTEP